MWHSFSHLCFYAEILNNCSCDSLTVEKTANYADSTLCDVTDSFTQHGFRENSWKCMGVSILLYDCILHTKILPSFTNPHVITKLYAFIYWAPLLLVFFRNVIFCVLQKKAMHISLDQHEGEEIMTQFYYYYYFLFI